MNRFPQCWCGNTDLAPFSAAYFKCPVCDTLVAPRIPETEIARVNDEENDFYGREYWFSHQEDELGLANIAVRSRTDLPERCLHWLRTILSYKLPPGRVLELGSAHGGFVAMLRWAGFDATGLELSPWVVQFAQDTFGAPTLLGPVEDQKIEPNSLDIIVLMDVLEHLPDPVGTMEYCLSLLKSDGVLVIQTPRFPEDQTYKDMVAQDAPFLKMLIENEHLYLFSRRSLREFFHRLGVNHFVFESAVFAHYDMFAIVSRTPLSVHLPDDIEGTLCATPSGRMVLALLDLDAKKNRITTMWAEAEADRAARLEVIHEQGRRLDEVGQQLEAVEADRAARLEVIQRQGAEIGQLYQQLYNIQSQWPVKLLRGLRLVKTTSVNSVSLLDGVTMPDQPPSREPGRSPDSADSVDFERGEDTAVDTTYTLEDYVLTVEAFNKTRPDMDSVRAYNHDMIEILSKLRPLNDKRLLDIGASPHGYALEKALEKGVSAYFGIGLNVRETIEVQHQGRIGRLIHMNAEELTFKSNTFDLILSLSTFEHFSDGARVLREMYRVLKPGGSVLIHFKPVWTCSYGHHLHPYESVVKLIPPWAHLIWNEETMRQALQGKWPADATISLQEAIEFSYGSAEINRVDIVTLRNMFHSCDFEIEWMTPLLDDKSDNKPIIADYLSKVLLYSAEDLMTLGFSILLNKR